MGAITVQHKFVGTPGALSSYYEEVSDRSATAAQGYYGVERNGILFDKLGGKAWDHLPGLNRELGLTRAEHFEFHNGMWKDQVLTKGNYALVWEKDEKGREIKVQNITTHQWQRVPVMAPVLDDAGKPVLSKATGDPLMKQATEPRSVAGIDVTYTLDKSACELMLAFPELTPLIEDCMLQAVNVANTIGIEERCKLVVKTHNGHKSKHTAELAWFTVFGSAARPSPEAIAEGFEVDPLIHAHSFIFASAWNGEKWQKIDGDELFKNRELRGAVFANEFNRLMEEAGVRIEYSAADKKGRIWSQIAGSNADIRDHFSSGRRRAHSLLLKFERENGRPPSKVELTKLMAQNKLKKSSKAKAADELGNLAQIALWKDSLDRAGLKLGISEPGQPVKRQRREDRVDELFRRLDQPWGVARDCDSQAVFGPEVILPAAFRAADGLGFSAEEIKELADTYENEHLILLRDAFEPSAKLYTTQALLDAEAFVADRLEQLSARQVWRVQESDVRWVIESQPHQLDSGQEALVRAMCGDNGLVHGIGAAGTGKSSAMKPANQALHRAGIVTETIVVAVARRRADQTARSVVADRGWSVEALKLAVERGWKPTDKTLIILDEAALFGTFDLAETLKAVGDARVVTIGDDKQLAAIGAAGWYSHEIEKRSPIELTHVYRQKNSEDRSAFEMIRQGDAHQALQNLVRRKRVFQAKDPEDLVARMAARWVHYTDIKYKKPEQIALIVTGSNDKTDSLNRAVQRERLVRSHLDPDQSFEVYEHGGRQWTLYAGDRIVFNRGVYVVKNDKAEAIRNGENGFILSISETGQAEIQIDGRDKPVLVKLKREEAVQPVCPSYAMSDSKWQGGEVSVVIVDPGNPGITTQNSVYSSVTRAVDTCEIVVESVTWGEHPVHRLGEAMTRASQKHLASEYFNLRPEVEHHEPSQESEAVQALREIEELRRNLHQSQGHEL